MTGKMINANGTPLMVPNDVTETTKGFYISYNNIDIGIYGDVTTALVLNDMTKFLILNGNHTKQYNEIISNGGDYDDCVSYFKNNSNKISKFSDKI